MTATPARHNTVHARTDLVGSRVKSAYDPRATPGRKALAPLRPRGDEEPDLVGHN
jgi:hypothetical protein